MSYCISMSSVYKRAYMQKERNRNWKLPIRCPLFFIKALYSTTGENFPRNILRFGANICAGSLKSNIRRCWQLKRWAPNWPRRWSWSVPLKQTRREAQQYYFPYNNQVALRECGGSLETRSSPHSLVSWHSHNSSSVVDTHLQIRMPKSPS